MQCLQEHSGSSSLPMCCPQPGGFTSHFICKIQGWDLELRTWREGSSERVKRNYLGCSFNTSRVEGTKLSLVGGSLSGAALAVNRAVISEAMRHRERRGLDTPALSRGRGQLRVSRQVLPCRRVKLE